MDVIKKSRNAPLPVARLAIMLEPRFMFDAAGVATGAEIIDQTINLAADTETAAPSGDVSELAAALSGGQIAFIDTSVEDYSTLVEGLDSDIEVVLLNGTGDAVAQMADALQGRSNLDAIHIISHGGEGLVVMGQTQLAGDNLEAYQEQLGVIGAALSQDGDILLYGCEIASGAGASFIDSLAGITGADIAASDDRTGHADLGGDWDLEVATGSIESDAPFSERALKDFTHLLSYSGTIDFSNINSAGAYNGTASINASFNVGSYVLVADGQDASTQAYNGSATASGGETRLTFYISGGGTFDVSSLRIYNLAGNGNTITVSSNLGDTHNTASLANDTWTNETLTGFTGITRLYLTGSIDVAFCYVDDMVVANFGAPANSAPTISIDGTPAYTEGGSAVTVDSSVTITDADGVDTDLDDGYLSVSITSGSISSDRLILDTTGSVGLAGTTVSVSGVNVGTLVDSSGTADDGTVNGSDTLRINFNSNITGAYAQTLAQAIQFSNVSDDPGTASRTVTFTINDGTDSGTDTATVSVTEVNDEPTLTATGSNPTFTEGGAAASLFSGTAIDTIESGQNISELIFTVTNVNDGASETISIDGTSVALTDGTSGTTGANSFGYAVSVTGTTATVTITRTDTAANYQTLVNNLAYVNSSDDPNTSNRVVTITSLKDNGGTANSGDDTNSTLSVASTVTVTAANDEPTLTATGSNPSFIEDGSAVGLFSSASISTVESGQNIASITLTITNIADGTNEFLVVDGTSVALTDGNSGTTGANSFGYSVSVTGTTATVTITKTDTTGNYQSLVNGLQYTNSQSDVNANNRVVTITQLVDSGANGGVDDNTAALSVASTVSMTNVNDEPTLTATGSNPTFTEGGAAASLFSGAAIDTIESGQNISELIFTVTNVNDGASETISIDGTSVALTDGNSGTTGANSFGYAVSVTGTTATVTITRTDTAANYQTLVNNLAYVNSSDDPNTSNRVVTITSLKDNGGTANSGDDTNATLSVASTVTVTAVNDAPTISNLDGDSVSFSIGGSAVALDSGAALSLSDADSTDFNGGNMTVSITANRQTAEDQLQVVTSGNITVSGTTITHSDSGGVTIGTVSGNNQSTSNLIVTLNANATVARVADLLAALRYYNSDSSTTNTAPRTITITVDDGDGGSSTSSNQNVTINLVRAPIIDLDGDDSTGAANGGYAGAFAEGGGAVALADSDSAISDDGTFRSLTVTLTNRPDGASESLSSTYGTGAQTVNGEAVTITAYNSSTGVLTITVDDGSTSDVTMQMLMESIRYNNSSDDPDTTDRTITFSATDDADNAGSAVNSVISVSGTNDNPTLSGLPSDITVVEDTASNVDLSAATLADVDSSGSNFTLTITAGAGTLAASSGGGVTVTNSGTSAITLTGTVSNIDAFLNTASNIQYTGATNVNGNDATTLTMTANDQDGSGDLNLGTVNVDITAVDDEPTLTATGANPDFVLGGTAVSLFSSTSISTIESGQNITQLVLTVTNISGTGTTEFITLDGTDVALSDGNSGVTGSNAFGYNVALAGGTATVTITKTDTTANYQALVDGMTYSTTLTATDGNDRVATITSLTDNGSNAGANDNVNSTLSVSSTVTLAEQAQDDTSDQGGLNDLSRSEQGANDGFGEEGSGDGSGQNTPTGSSEPFGTDGIVGINTISGLVALEGGLIDPGNIGDPSMGIDTICILRGAVTGNNGALNHYYGSGILSTVGIEDDPVEYPGFEDGGFGGLFGGFGGGLGTGFGGLGSFFQGASNSGLGDSERVLGGQLDEEGAGERMPGMGVPVERGRLGEAMQTEPLNKGGQEVVFGKPAFSRQLANAALEQEDVRWGALAAALGQPGLRDQ